MFEFCSRTADYSPSSEAKAAVSLWPAWISFMSWWFLYVSAKLRCSNFLVLYFTGELMYHSVHPISFSQKKKAKGDERDVFACYLIGIWLLAK